MTSASSSPAARAQWALRTWLVALCALVTLAVAPTARADQLSNMVDVLGARDNQLIGYGIVTGLDGTGDNATAPYAPQSLRALLRRLGVQVDAKQVLLRNVAAVVVTATIPPFYRSGQKLDIVVSSIGNAKSLNGGVLLQTPLRGADRKTYAVAQGPLVLGGYSAAGSSGSSSKTNAQNTARIPNGALVERMIPSKLVAGDKLTLTLRQPDYTTAARIVAAIDKELGKGSAAALDGGAVTVKAPKGKSPVELLARLAPLEVEPHEVARVIINERTGTIVAGGDVRLSPVAISQGGITIAVKETPKVSQPGALAGGSTATVVESKVEVTEKQPPALSFVNGATKLADVATALSAFGVTPRELTSLLQALKAAGALRAELIVQ